MCDELLERQRGERSARGGAFRGAFGAGALEAQFVHGADEGGEDGELERERVARVVLQLHVTFAHQLEHLHHARRLLQQRCVHLQVQRQSNRVHIRAVRELAELVQKRRGQLGTIFQTYACILQYLY